MKLHKQLACVAGALIALLSLASIASAETLLPPPVQTVIVTRGHSFDDLNEMKDDGHLIRLTDVVSDYVESHVGPIDILDLEIHLMNKGWPVDRIEEDEYEYIYLLDPDGQIREYCYIVGDLYIDDGEDLMLRIGLRLDQDLTE